MLLLDEAPGLATEGRDPGLLSQLRGLHTETAWFTPVLAGLHDLDDPYFAKDASAAYAQLVADARRLEVGLLPPADARDLLLRPHPDADLKFAPDAEDRLLHEAAGQAFLVKQMGQLVVESVNGRIRRGDPDRTCTLADAEHAVGERLFERGRAYFDGVWAQAVEHQEAESALRTLTTANRLPDIADRDACLEHLVGITVLGRSDRDEVDFVVPAFR